MAKKNDFFLNQFLGKSLNALQHNNLKLEMEKLFISITSGKTRLDYQKKYSYNHFLQVKLIIYANIVVQPTTI